MKIEEQKQGAVTILRPVGALTREGADDFQTIAVESMRRTMGRIVLDGSAIAYVDSRGLETLLAISTELGAGGRMLKVCGFNETVREAMDLTDLASNFDFYADLNTAVRSFL